MAGHSQFKNIMYRKGAQDAKKAKIFTKITREIITAAKSGMPEPANNPRLRSAIQWAREENMPRDRIETAIKRATSSNDTDNFTPIRYEGYGAGGTALIIEALTDNRNRTASDIRSAFSKFGGNLGETGSVSFMFNRLGLVIFPAEAADEEKMLEAAIEAGANNCERVGDQYEITCEVESLAEVRDALEKAISEPQSAKIIWQPANLVAVSEDQAQSNLKLMEMLEDNDDVQNVFSNIEIPDNLLQEMA